MIRVATDYRDRLGERLWARLGERLGDIGGAS